MTPYHRSISLYGNTPTQRGNDRYRLARKQLKRAGQNIGDFVNDSTTEDKAKSNIIKKVARYNGTLNKAQKPLFRAFVKSCVNRIRGPFLARHTPKEVLETLETAFLYAWQRKEGDVKVTITPNKKNGLTIISVMQDQPFIVDSTRLFLERKNADYLGGFNLIFNVVRDDKGFIVGAGRNGLPESLMFLESSEGDLLNDIDAAILRLTKNLKLARAAVHDFKTMTACVTNIAETLKTDAKETAGFLQWLVQENFVFMGVTQGDNDYGIQTIEGPFKGNAGGDWPTSNAFGIQVRKTACESPVHRAGRIDEIRVSHPTKKDEILLYIRGMFTYRAVTQPSRHVPILRRVVASLLVESETIPGSYQYKGIGNVFDSLPTEFLLTATESSVHRMVNLVIDSEQQKEVGATFIPTGTNGLFCLIAMPKRQYSDDLRERLESELIETLGATYTDHGLFVGRYDTVLLHFYLTGARSVSEETLDVIARQIKQMATPWRNRLWRRLAKQYDDTTADRLIDTYGSAFPKSWMRSATTLSTLLDIVELQKLSGRTTIASRVWSDSDETWLRIYQAVDITLSDILPVFHNFDLTAISSSATTVRPRGGKLFIDTFLLNPEGKAKEIVDTNPQLLLQALKAVFDGTVTNDSLNRLTLTSGLNWKQVDIIRAYSRYCRQLKVAVSATRTRQLLLIHPILCRHLVTLFEARFDPAISGRKKAISKALERIDKSMKTLRTHDEDTLFGIMRNLILSTTRTNAFRTDKTEHYLSFKVDCSRIPEMGERPPFREIYVHHKEVEGLHIRFGMVARGGLRWSDRDDYRTEILGLASTQLVKNVVIVPTGSKGGFILKHPNPDTTQRRADADHYYQIFIRGLLDVTDNAIGGKIVHHPEVVSYDGDDSYLVVAADKGTAHLSDTANKISLSYNYWLGDAFASGGSNGYDHKVVGITARGAWVLTRRHFAEMGRDPYTEPFTVVGIGDMGGDVFGNGLIESPHAKLKVAFNHRHVFLDPNPIKKCAAERKRLFKLGRAGGWDAFNTKLISKGGGLYNRTDKAIPLSSQVQEMLNLTEEKATPAEVIRAALKMKVDLLWNGGIGTYVKSSEESDADANDRATDSLRINGVELGAAVVGEGGNLGFTHAGRIESCAAGTRMNTDFIDNSGGVDMSDHEVNLKILFSRAIAEEKMTLKERNKVLETMTEEVAHLVLANNDRHGRQISRDMMRFKENLSPIFRTISFIERETGVSRSSIGLPTAAQLTARAEEGGGITRPELAVLSAHIKMYVYKALLADTPTALHSYEKLLVSYFPKLVQKKFPTLLREHMLANEIAVSVAINDVVADAGVAFFPIFMESTGRSVMDITNAFLKAQFLAQTPQVRTSLEELRTSVSRSDLHNAWINIDAGVRRVAKFWLSALGDIPSDDQLAEMPTAIDTVVALQSPEVKAANKQMRKQLRGAEIPNKVINQITRAQYLGTAIMVWVESNRTDSAIEVVASTHLAAVSACRLDEVLDLLSTCPASGRWEPIGVHILENRFQNHLRAIVRATIGKGDQTKVRKFAKMLASGPLSDVRAQVDAILDGDTPASIATLMVLEARVAGAVARLE
jgi:glutamate dehydrogenase